MGRLTRTRKKEFNFKWGGGGNVFHNELPPTVLISVKFSHEAALRDKKLQSARTRRAFSHIRA